MISEFIIFIAALILFFSRFNEIITGTVEEFEKLKKDLAG